MPCATAQPVAVTPLRQLQPQHGKRILCASMSKGPDHMCALGYENGDIALWTARDSRDAPRIAAATTEASVTNIECMQSGVVAASYSDLTLMLLRLAPEGETGLHAQVVFKCGLANPIRKLLFFADWLYILQVAVGVAAYHPGSDTLRSDHASGSYIDFTVLLGSCIDATVAQQSSRAGAGADAKSEGGRSATDKQQAPMLSPPVASEGESGVDGDIWSRTSLKTYAGGCTMHCSTAADAQQAPINGGLHRCRTGWPRWVWSSFS